MPDTQRPTDLLAAIRASDAEFTPKLRRIAEFALTDPERFIRGTSRDVCSHLGTSEPTLIRFCQQLGYAGLSDFRIDLALAYAHQAQGRPLIEPLAHDRRQVNAAAKRAIAARAASLVEADRSLLIDNGSTAEFFAMALADSPAKTIMTTGLWVAQRALDQGSHTVMLTGGRLRAGAMVLSGRLVEQSLAQMRFDTFVMGADSIDPKLGLSTFLEDEAHQTRAMVEAAARVIVLADRTKLKSASLHHICGFDRIDILVTDLDPQDPAVGRIADRGVRVLTTEPEDHPT
ncbi:MAG: transcriptional regulator [Pseudomonadota bacterium]